MFVGMYTEWNIADLKSQQQLQIVRIQNAVSLTYKDMHSIQDAARV